MKMTFQPKKRQRSKVHGFRKRMATANGRKVFSCKKKKRQKSFISIILKIFSIYRYNRPLRVAFYNMRAFCPEKR